MKTRIITDALGFTLKLDIEIGQFETFGKHICYGDETGLVPLDSEHTIQLKYGMTASDSVNVAAHEAYHLFYAIRHLITCDEETEAETFGHLVRRIVLFYMENPMTPEIGTPQSK